MKYCDPHWEMLKAAIDERGLMHLAARDGREAADQMVAEIKGEPTEFVDPLDVGTEPF